MKSKYKTSDYSIDSGFEDILALHNYKSGKYDIELDFKRKEIRIVKYGTFDKDTKMFERGWKLINSAKLKIEE